MDQKNNQDFIQEFPGMPKNLVLHHSNTPFFKILRLLLCALVAMLVTLLLVLSAITISNSAPCLEYWQTSGPIYQIYPISFKDSNSDGVGDLQGIIEKIDYLEDLGIGSVWLNPIYESPFVDMGYDVSDYYKIKPVFGDFSDFKMLVNELHKRRIRLIMDFVPNHTSDQHEWFIASEDPTHELHEKYKDYYVWKEANYNGTENCPKNLKDNNGVPYPNNWVSAFGGPAWKWSD